MDWVQQQWAKKPAKFWSSGLHDYLRHQAKIRREFADVIEEGGWAGGQIDAWRGGRVDAWRGKGVRGF